MYLTLVLLKDLREFLLILLALSCTLRIHHRAPIRDVCWANSLIRWETCPFSLKRWMGAIWYCPRGMVMRGFLVGGAVRGLVSSVSSWR